MVDAVEKKFLAFGMRRIVGLVTMYG